MPFIRKVRVLFKTRLIFPRINGPIVSLKRKDHILQAIYRKWPSVCLFIICKIRGEKQTSTWNHSIGGYGTHGNGSQHCLKSRRKTENKVKFFSFTGLHSTTHIDTWVGDTIIEKKFSFN